jgi:hypothetical protein
VTGDATRTSTTLEPLDGDADREGAGKVGARKPGDLTPTVKPNALVERGGSVKRCLLGLVAVALALLPAAPAGAAPVTVNLRIEGATRTLFEGPVTTDVRRFQFSGDPNTYECDGLAPAGSSTTPVPTRGAAITAAAQAGQLTMTGTFDTTYQSPIFATVDGENVTYDSNTGKYLAEFKNGQPSQTGACGDPLSNGDDVLFAYATPSDTVLQLSGPATAAPGTPVVLHVTNRADGSPVAGAAVAGSTSGSDGAVTVGPFSTTGPQDLKASESGAIRSNRVSVCITTGADGACGTTVPAATPMVARSTTGPRGKIVSIREGQHFAKGKGPRALKGIVTPDPSGIGDVRLRLTRNDHGQCQTFDGRTERLVKLKRCGAKRGKWFSAGDREQWSYLLPSRLGRGRWVLDLQVRDKAGNIDTLLQRTRTRVVFTVS